MATWVIERKVIVWYRTEVEADTFEDAVDKSWESSDWELNEDSHTFTDDFWGKNTETDKEFDTSIGEIN